MSTTIILLHVYISLFHILFISLQTQKQNHFGSCFFSNFILLKVLGLDNAARFYSPYLYGFYGVHEVSDIWVSIPTVGFSQVLLPTLFLLVCWKIKCSIISGYALFCSQQLVPELSKSSSLSLLSRPGLDPSKLTILWTISRTRANFLQFLHNFPTHDIFWHIIIFLSSCPSWFMTQKCTLSRK